MRAFISIAFATSLSAASPGATAAAEATYAVKLLTPEAALTAAQADDACALAGIKAIADAIEF